MASDTELLEAWRRGDATAGEQLFDRHFASVRRFFRSKAPATEVEDLVQATFEACVQHLEQFRGEARFVTYLLAIARSQLHRWLRRRDPVRAGLDVEASSIQDLGTSPSVKVAGREQQRELVEALRRLPLAMQTMLELHYWDDLNAAELAIVFGLEPNAVRVRLHRARAALREQLLAGRAAHTPTPEQLDDDVREAARLF
jgi:RNA polymerase sigma-70 factor (ECF subfamily)